MHEQKGWVNTGHSYNNLLVLVVVVLGWTANLQENDLIISIKFRTQRNSNLYFAHAVMHD